MDHLIDAKRELFEMLEVYSDDERAELLQYITGEFCRSCGSDSGSSCQCENDE